ncbi:AAA family ATPase [Glaciecola petra]|uniref:MoxR family ATPase n=1 Tax=Glaciecola petra TaxID=3075602 RepID=A0ABU2ZQ65_9ALTE|nr:MoxR family ATPase [Aestuariibacter sp. P117]MDT0594752.1 MoxR family ATPase [Aestuariibacter sp. P117]
MSDLTQQELDTAKNVIGNLISNIEIELIGQTEVVEQVIVSFLAGGHVLLEGVPGLGKTLLVRLLANSISLDYKRVQFTPDLMPADVTGHSIVNMKTGEFNVKKGPVFTNLLLADEINRAPAKTQAALLEVMQEQQVTIDGQAHSVGRPFMVLATQNPIDNEGTYPLPEAELDRFMMKVVIGYPSAESEILLTQQISASAAGSEQAKVSEVIDAQTLDSMREMVKKVTVDPLLVQYAVNIVRTTREWQGISHGAGVRASIALIQAAKVAALIEGIGFVTPDHIKKMMYCVLRHRVSLSAEREIAGVSIDNVLSELCESVEVPRQ